MTTKPLASAALSSSSSFKHSSAKSSLRLNMSSNRCSLSMWPRTPLCNSASFLLQTMLSSKSASSSALATTTLRECRREPSPSSNPMAGTKEASASDASTERTAPTPRPSRASATSRGANTPVPLEATNITAFMGSAISSSISTDILQRWCKSTNVCRSTVLPSPSSKEVHLFLL
eukprot:280012_1